MIYANHIFIISSPILAVVIPCALMHLFHPVRYNLCEIKCQESPWSMVSCFKDCSGISSFFAELGPMLVNLWFQFPVLSLILIFTKCSAVLMSFNPCRDNGNCSPVLAHKIDLKAINEMVKLSLKHQNDT